MAYKDNVFNVIKTFHEKKTGWELLQQEWDAIEPKGLGDKNTDYRNTMVDLNDLRAWDQFPTVEDIRLFSTSTPALQKAFHECQLEVIAGDQRWYDRHYEKPDLSLVLAEINVVEMMKDFFLQLNALIRLATDTTGQTSAWVTINGAKGVRKRRVGGTPEKKDPDRAAFWTDGEHPLRHAEDRGPHIPTETPCLLVGDYKMVGKFNHQMLVGLSKGKRRAEAQKVMNQIHDYMDMHNNRFGYIITETEVVMFQRREGEEGSGDEQKWGQLDYSPSLPIHTKHGERSALMVLWYFHVKYAVLNLEGGWELPSFYHNCPSKFGGGRYAEEEVSGNADQLIQEASGSTSEKLPKKGKKKPTAKKRGVW
jgi:hypothetical protein